MRDDAKRHSTTGLADVRIDWRIGVTCALGLSLVFAAQSYVNDPTTTSFGVLVARQLVTWLLWLAFTPVIFDVGRLMRRRGVLRPSSLALFIVAGLVMSAVHATTSVIVQSALDITQSGELGTAIMMSISRYLATNLVRFACISSIYLAIAYHRDVREREGNAALLATSLAQARLETIEGRLQPHFLFNTLNALKTLIGEDPRAAEDMVQHLSELLRATLDANTAHEVTLQHELDVLSHYIAIQRSRFHARLEVMIESEPDALAAYIPHCMLLPIVENAIRHGIAPRDAAGTVWIRGIRHGDALHLHVQDDGVGIGRAPPATGSRGIGIGSTRARLTQLYGSAGRFHIGQVLPTGTLVTIELPFRTEARGSEVRPS
ncbi:MAG: histidine kinase [Gemmatimonadaceae bacterium]